MSRRRRLRGARTVVGEEPGERQLGGRDASNANPRRREGSGCKARVRGETSRANARVRRSPVSMRRSRARES